MDRDSQFLPRESVLKSSREVSASSVFGPYPTHWLFCQFADRWTLSVLCSLQFSAKRFKEVQESLHPISHRALSRCLQKLVRIGLVKRTAIPSSPRQMRYEVSELGRSLAQPLGRLIHWSQHNIDTVRQARTGQH